MEEQYKKLYRVQHDKILGGVSGGLAEYFNVDISAIRLIFFLLTFLGGGGLFIYLILWIALPMKPYTENTSYSTYHNQPNMKNQTENTTNSYNNENNQQPKNAQRNKIFSGIILITVGVLFLLDEFIPKIYFRNIWPVILIVIGIMLIFNNYRSLNQK